MADKTSKPNTWDLGRQYVLDRTLLRYQGQWLRWTGPNWEEVHRDLMQSDIAHWLVERGIEPKSQVVSDVEYHAVSLRARRLGSLPAWDGEPLATNILSCRNGLVDLETGKLHPHTPRYVNLNAVDYDYDANVGEPTAWMSFLDSIWKDDPECIAVLQRMFGYLLTPNTCMQRMFQLMGPPRSGKGTIGDVISEVMGRENVCSPSLQSITGGFALQPAVGKLLMLLSEARLDGRNTNRAAITDVLLRIVGEDHFTVDRKFKDAWQGVLTTRIVIQTNEPLELSDDTGALLRRLIVLPMTKSFYGKEDLTLRERLRAERGAILKWAMEGWRLLQHEGGMIHQPASGEHVIAATRTAASPLTGFLDEKCDIDADATCDKTVFYAAYRSWCEDNGSHPMAKSKLTQKLEANYPIRGAKGPWINKDESNRAPPVYRGVRLLRMPAELENGDMPF